MAVTRTSREEVRARAAGLCEYCHADEKWQFVRFTIDHIVPRSANGGDEPNNLALACRNCNERRSNLMDFVDPLTNEEIPIFNPRDDLWNDHFCWDAEGIRILGLTATGRATVNLFDLNDERHSERCLRTRRRDLKDGFHPPKGDRRDTND